MSLTEYLRILVRRGWIMILLAVVIAASAYLYSRQQTPVYRATQLVLIQPSRTDFGLTEASRLLLNSLVVYLNSRERAQEIIDELRLDMTPGQLLSNTTTNADQLRLTIQIDVDSTDPEIATQVARAWGQELVDYRNRLNQEALRADHVNADLVDFPAAGQQSPRPFILAAAGGILGLLLGGIVVFILEYLESIVVRRGDDIERAMELPVLASIPES
ncbi:MAG: hypothetical protein OHK0046_41020 [Anaerolineae bacterium]